MGTEQEYTERDIKDYSFSYVNCDGKIVPIVVLKCENKEIKFDLHDLDTVSGMFKYWDIWWERNKDGIK
jgi:hypothetical protein